MSWYDGTKPQWTPSCSSAPYRATRVAVVRSSPSQIEVLTIHAGVIGIVHEGCTAAIGRVADRLPEGSWGRTLSDAEGLTHE